MNEHDRSGGRQGGPDPTKVPTAMPERAQSSDEKFAVQVCHAQFERHESISAARHHLLRLAAWLAAPALSSRLPAVISFADRALADPEVTTRDLAI